MPTLSAARRVAAPSGRTRRYRTGHPVLSSAVGQSFDIEISRAVDGWLIRIPEIGAVTHASRRAAVEIAARECIAVRTGIPIGYVAVAVRD